MGNRIARHLFVLGALMIAGSVASAGCSGSVEEPSTSCGKAIQKLSSCGLIAKGSKPPCEEPNTDYSLCVNDCLMKADCSSLKSLFCDHEMSDNSIETCADACERSQQGAARVAMPTFTCKNGYTVSLEYKCDGEEDCEDGSDEAGCPVFECANGETIPADYKCDWDDDCEDGSDEAGCPVFECANGEAIPVESECDEYEDCEDGSDEEGCGGFECANGEIIPEDYQCDGGADCRDGSDERGCEQSLHDVLICD
jgi:hypothetical protein